MLHNALWKIHYKQTKYIIWSFLLVSFFYPVSLFIEIGKLNLYQPSLNASLWITTIQMICLVVIATILQGRERSNQSLDCTLALPYKRKDILLSKWAIGVTTILVANIIPIAFVIPIIKNSILSSSIPVTFIILYFFATSITLIGIYSLSLLVGQVVGNQYGQFVASGLLLFFPFYFWVLLYMGYLVNVDPYITIARDIEGDILTLMYVTTMPVFLVNFDIGVMIPNNTLRTEPFIFLSRALLTPALFTILYLSLLGAFSRRMNSEKNGKLFIYEKLKRIALVSITISFYLLGGWIFAGWLFERPDPLIPYHIGGLTFASMFYTIIYLNRKKQMKASKK
jgi:acetoin utilization transport system permease protein